MPERLSETPCGRLLRLSGSHILAKEMHGSGAVLRRRPCKAHDLARRLPPWPVRAFMMTHISLVPRPRRNRERTRKAMPLLLSALSAKKQPVSGTTGPGSATGNLAPGFALSKPCTRVRPGWQIGFNWAPLHAFRKTFLAPFSTSAPVPVACHAYA